MPFRNPTTSLPADAITGRIDGTTQVLPGSITTPSMAAGTITAELLSADAIDGKLITGATIRTAASGKRILLTPEGDIILYSGAAMETTPGEVVTGINHGGPGLTFGYLVLKPPTHSGHTAPEIVLSVGPDGTTYHSIGALNVMEDGGQGYATVAGTLTVTGNADVFGDLGAEAVHVQGIETARLIQGWTNLALKSGFTGGTPDACQWRRFMLLDTEFVQFRGRVTHAGLTGDTVFATLSSAKPSVTRRFPAARNNSGAQAVAATRIDWNPSTGDLTVFNQSASPVTFFSLDGALIPIT